MQLTSISPFFIVRDLPTAIAHYVDQFGFRLHMQAPEHEPFFAIVGRDAISTMLKQIGPNTQPQPNHTGDEWARWDAFIEAPDSDALYAEFQGRDIDFHEPLADTDDGLRGCEVKDADGYVLFFGRPR